MGTLKKAVWRGTVLAESEHTRSVEGNAYFPPESVNQQYMKPSSHTTVCFWKGEAGYHHVEVDGEVLENAAWHYPQTSKKAEPIRGYFAFWKGVEVTEG